MGEITLEQSIHDTLTSIDKTMKAIMVLLQRHLTIQELQLEVAAIRELNNVYPSTKEMTIFRTLEILGMKEDERGRLVKTEDRADRE
jgi:hypothetical protein